MFFIFVWSFFPPQFEFFLKKEWFMGFTVSVYSAFEEATPYKTIWEWISTLWPDKMVWWSKRLAKSKGKRGHDPLNCKPYPPGDAWSNLVSWGWQLRFRQWKFAREHVPPFARCSKWVLRTQQLSVGAKVQSWSLIPPRVGSLIFIECCLVCSLCNKLK